MEALQITTPIYQPKIDLIYARGSPGSRPSSPNKRPGGKPTQPEDQPESQPEDQPAGEQQDPGDGYDPADLTNRGRSATAGDEVKNELRNTGLTVKNYVTDFQKRVNDGGLLEFGPWLFWSGDNAKFSPAVFQKAAFTKRTQTSINHIREVNTEDQGERKGDWSRAKGPEWAFWSVSSKAYAEITKGDVWVVLPKGAPVNKPYKDVKPGAGSNWWSYEVPILTRSENVERIIRIDRETDGLNSDNDKYTTFGVIWKKGDQPWGFDGNEWQKPAVLDTPDFHPPSTDKTDVLGWQTM